MRFLLVFFAACSGSQHPTTANPTCTDVVEHGYSILSRDLSGDHAIAARREFVRIRPSLVEKCEQSPDLTIDRKRCIMSADSGAEVERCEH